MAVYVPMIKNGKVRYRYLSTFNKGENVDSDLGYIIHKLNELYIPTTDCCEGHDIINIDRVKCHVRVITGAYISLRITPNTELFLKEVSKFKDLEIYYPKNKSSVIIYFHPIKSLFYKIDKNKSCISNVLKLRLKFLIILEKNIKSYIKNNGLSDDCLTDMNDDSCRWYHYDPGLLKSLLQ